MLEMRSNMSQSVPPSQSYNLEMSHFVSEYYITSLSYCFLKNITPILHAPEQS